MAAKTEKDVQFIDYLFLAVKISTNIKDVVFAVQAVPGCGVFTLLHSLSHIMYNT